MNIHAASFLEKKTGAFYVFNARTKGIGNFICLRGVQHLNFFATPILPWNYTKITATD